jgi:hypothetical protein
VTAKESVVPIRREAKARLRDVSKAHRGAAIRSWTWGTAGSLPPAVSAGVIDQESARSFLEMSRRTSSKLAV